MPRQEVAPRGEIPASGLAHRDVEHGRAFLAAPLGGHRRDGELAQEPWLRALKTPTSTLTSAALARGRPAIDQRERRAPARAAPRPRTRPRARARARPLPGGRLGGTAR